MPAKDAIAGELEDEDPAVDRLLRGEIDDDQVIALDCGLHRRTGREESSKFRASGERRRLTSARSLKESSEIIACRNVTFRCNQLELEIRRAENAEGTSWQNPILFEAPEWSAAVNSRRRVIDRLLLSHEDGRK